MIATPMQRVKGAIDVLRGRAAAVGAPQGRHVRYWKSRDAAENYALDAATGKKIVSQIRAADAGDLAAWLELCEELERRDPHLKSVTQTRELALTLLEWEIEPAHEHDDTLDRDESEKVRDLVATQIAAIDAFDERLEHLAKAISRNLAVAELVWEGSKLVDVDAVPHGRLWADYNDAPTVRVRTQEDQYKGVPAAWGKFVVHRHDAVGVNPVSGALYRPGALVWLAKSIALKDWTIFAEVFGMPARIATYGPSATEADKREALEMLEKLGADAVAIFSEAMQVDFKESGGRQGAPYKDLIDWAERKQSVLLLGQTLTTDTSGGTGTYAAASVHDAVRGDYVEADCARESRTVTRQVLRPIVAYNFGADALKYTPRFKRKSRETIDRAQEGQVMSIAVNDLGLRVSQDFAYDRLGIPKPETDADGVPVDVLEGRKQPEAGAFGGGGFGGGFGNFGGQGGTQ